MPENTHVTVENIHAAAQRARAAAEAEQSAAVEQARIEELERAKAEAPTRKAIAAEAAAAAADLAASIDASIEEYTAAVAEVEASKPEVLAAVQHAAEVCRDAQAARGRAGYLRRRILAPFTGEQLAEVAARLDAIPRTILRGSENPIPGTNPPVGHLVVRGWVESVTTLDGAANQGGPARAATRTVIDALPAPAEEKPEKPRTPAGQDGARNGGSTARFVHKVEGRR